VNVLPGLGRRVVGNVAAAGELVAAILPKLPWTEPASAAEITADWLTTHVADTASAAVAQRVLTLDGLAGRPLRPTRLASDLARARVARGVLLDDDWSGA